jgi:magnesium chelatase family protein
MLAKVLSSAVMGVDAYLVEVEVDIAMGLPTFNTVGLPDTSVKESRDRVKAAIKNSGFDFPSRRITVNLAPADIKKEGASFDLPMACGILAATGLIRPERLKDHLILGELSLDGGVRSIKGALPMAASAAHARWPG